MTVSSQSCFSKGKRERYCLINSAVIKHPRMTIALRKIEDCRQMSKGAREPECMLIVGESGVGKTTLKDHYLSKNKRTETASGTTVPVLAVNIPVPATISMMVSTMLAELGDPIPYKGEIGARKQRLCKLLIECKVEVIFLDEFHHFIDRDSDKVIKWVSDWLKNLISEVKIPVILAGLPKSRQILEFNEQLRRRFSCQINLSPFAWQRAGRKEFKRILKLVQESLHLETKLDFDDDEVARRFFHATSGNISRMMKVARGAAFIAIKEGHGEITLELLARSYVERLLPQRDKGQELNNKNNPFHMEWVPPTSQSFTTANGADAHEQIGRSRSEVRGAVEEVFRAR